MDEVMRLIEEDTMKMERLFMSSSLSKKKQLLFDLGSLVSLYEMLGLDTNDIHFNRKFASKYMIEQVDTIVKYIKEFEGVANQVINMHKDLNFYCYLRNGKVEFTHQEKMDILREFLEYFNPEVYKLYKEMYDQKRLLVVEDDLYGEAFMLDTINSYYLVLSNFNKMDSIFEIETMIHELTHIYSSRFLMNYSSKYRWNYNIGFYSEATTMYSELSFYEWMKKNKICVEDMDMHRNLVDYYGLQFYKTMKYIAEMSKRKNVQIKIGDGVYQVISLDNTEEATKLNLDDGVPFYQYHSELKNGMYNDFIYSMSNIRSFELIEKELNGEKPLKLINEYLLTFGDKKMLEKHFEDLDLSSYQKVLGKRMDEFNKKYPR